MDVLKGGVFGLPLCVLHGIGTLKNTEGEPSFIIEVRYRSVISGIWVSIVDYGYCRLDKGRHYIKARVNVGPNAFGDGEVL